MNDNSSTDVEIKYSSNCPKPIQNGCSNIRAGEIVNFTAIIKPLKCSGDTNTKTIRIKPEAVDESLIVELEVICDCDCERPDHPDYQADAEECATQGSLQCGVCSCNQGRFGRNCECDKETSVSNDVSSCKVNKNDSVVCSGLGTCKCGEFLILNIGFHSWCSLRRILVG